MDITKDMQKIIADKFKQAPSVESFKKEMTKTASMGKLVKNMKHQKVMRTVRILS